MADLASFATGDWRFITGTADGFGLTGIPFEALESDAQRITLWSVAGETWITAALRPGWDATRQVPDGTDLGSLIAALIAGEVERSPLAPPPAPLFAGLFGRTPPEPVTGAELHVAGVVLAEWPLTRGGGVFTNVSPAWGTGS